MTVKNATKTEKASYKLYVYCFDYRKLPAKYANIPISDSFDIPLRLQNRIWNTTSASNIIVHVCFV